MRGLIPLEPRPAQLRRDHTRKPFYVSPFINCGKPIDANLRVYFPLETRAKLGHRDHEPAIQIDVYRR